MRLFKRVLFVALAILVCSAFATAQQDQPATGASSSEMDAMMKLISPGEKHKILNNMIGDWTFTNKMWMDPSQAPAESKGTMHAEWILGGRYVQSVWKGDFMGMPFEGHGTDGYDNGQKMFVSSWVDNMGTGIMQQTGSCTDDGKSCTFTGEVFDVMKGQKVMSRSVSQWLDDKTLKMEMFSTDSSGKEIKNMEIVATKK